MLADFMIPNIINHRLQSDQWNLNYPNGSTIIISFLFSSIQHKPKYQKWLKSNQ